MSTAPPAVELVPAGPSIPNRWFRFAAPVVALILVLPFLDDTFSPAELLRLFVAYTALVCVYRTATMRYSFKRVTFPPAGAAIDERRGNWLTDEGALLAIGLALCVVGVDWAPYVLVLPAGDAVADAWQARTIGRFEREKGLRVFRRKDPKLWNWKYFALPRT